MIATEAYKYTLDEKVEVSINQEWIPATVWSIEFMSAVNCAVCVILNKNCPDVKKKIGHTERIYKVEYIRKLPITITGVKGVHDEGKKFDTDKLRLDLLPIKPLMDIGEVLTLGAKKYGDRNWEKGLAWSRVYGALQRHLFAWYNGEDKDEESGESHLAHAACCITFLLEYEKTHRELDDRPNTKLMTEEEVIEKYMKNEGEI